MQHLVLLTTGLYIGLLAAVLSKMPLHLDKSISFHIAQNEWSIRLTRWVLIVMHLLLLVWLWGWAVSALGLTWDFVLTFVLACVFGALSGVVPFTGSPEQMRLHNAFAWMYAVLIVMLDASLFAQSEHLLAQIALLTITAVQGFIFFIHFRYRPSKKYFLYIQIVFMLLFGVALITATYA